jgi:acetolactate synthase-1/2/3 large subunit
VTGEGSIQMCIQELSTCKQYRLPVKIINLNNGYIGMVRQWQELFHGNRYAESYMDAAGLREAGRGLRPRRHAHREAGRCRGRAEGSLQAQGRSGVHDFIDPTENVYPMVQGGKGLTEMILSEEL